VQCPCRPHLFLYLYQIYIIQFWTSKRPCVRKVIQTIEPHYVCTRVRVVDYHYLKFLFVIVHQPSLKKPLITKFVGCPCRPHFYCMKLKFDTS
jgi:hypothetical protein